MLTSGCFTPASWADTSAWPVFRSGSGCDPAPHADGYWISHPSQSHQHSAFSTQKNRWCSSSRALIYWSDSLRAVLLLCAPPLLTKTSEKQIDRDREGERERQSSSGVRWTGICLLICCNLDFFTIMVLWLIQANSQGSISEHSALRADVGPVLFPSGGFPQFASDTFTIVHYIQLRTNL